MNVKTSNRVSLSTTPRDGTTSLVPGEARCPGPSMQEIRRQDVHPAGAPLDEESYVFCGDEDIPYDRYTSRNFFDREIRKVWGETWQWTCREEHIPDTGDNYVYEIGPYSVLVVRQDDGSVKAFVNSCMHGERNSGHVKGWGIRRKFAVLTTAGAGNLTVRSTRCPVPGISLM